LNNTVVSNNQANQTGGGVESAGILQLNNSTIKDNKTFLAGGGIFTNGSATLMNVIISGNILTSTNGVGGGFAGLGNATLTKVSILSNTNPYNGGGIGYIGNLTISTSSITGNLAQFGAGMSIKGQVTVTESTIANNTASATGGGITTGASMKLENVTLSGNVAQYAGGAIDNGGIMTITNATFNQNTITNTQAGGIGGSIYVDYNITSSVSLKNTIISNSALGGNCAVAMGIGIISLGHNLSSDNTCNLTATGDMTNSNPLLGPLQNNGGATLTHALLPGSPAVNAGDNYYCPSFDQRGVLRPQASICDIGAYEFVFPLLQYLPIIRR
jgi:hypothetical protein